jgi:hypothetical protein
MVRTALRNGAVFEIPYTSALDSTAKRNWWATAREVVRVTKGKGVIVTGGGMDIADLRAPKDIGNLCVQSSASVSLLTGSIRVTFLGLAQNLAHDAATTTPKSVVLRARAFFLYIRSSRFTQALYNLVNSQKPVERIVRCSRSRNWLYQTRQVFSLRGPAIPWKLSRQGNGVQKQSQLRRRYFQYLLRQNRRSR